jgi:alkylhydroperoxidase family enzyme
MDPRISRLDKEQVDEETGKIYDVYLKERGNVPNMFRTAAHRPEIFRTMIAHLRAVMNTGTVSPKLKELVIVRTSQLNGCEY